MIWRRHVLATIAFIITNSYTWLNILFMFNDKYKESYGNINIDFWWVKILKILFACQGYFVPVIRLSEPYFYNTAIKELKGLCKQK